MDRNANDAKGLRSHDAPGGRPADGDIAPPPFTLTLLGPDPSMGWAGWGAGTVAGWAAAQAGRIRDEHDHPRREPREQ